jgi:predicted PurR-regulated permease PerM
MTRARFIRGGKHAAADGEQTGPLVGTIAIVTFVGANVPYLGASIAGGSLFGMIGLVLAAPVTSAIVRITQDLAGAPAPAVSEQEDSL